MLKLRCVGGRKKFLNFLAARYAKLLGLCCCNTLPNKSNQKRACMADFCLETIYHKLISKNTGHSRRIVNAWFNTFGLQLRSISIFCEIVLYCAIKVIKKKNYKNTITKRSFVFYSEKFQYETIKKPPQSSSDYTTDTRYDVYGSKHVFRRMCVCA